MTYIAAQHYERRIEDLLCDMAADSDLAAHEYGQLLELAKGNIDASLIALREEGLYT
jgi:hypothetical protein